MLKKILIEVLQGLFHWTRSKSESGNKQKEQLERVPSNKISEGGEH